VHPRAGAEATAPLIPVEDNGEPIARNARRIREEAAERLAPRLQALLLALSQLGPPADHVVAVNQPVQM